MNYKKYFPYFKNNPTEIYFDSAATALKPELVLQAEYDYNAKIGANTHNNLFANAFRANEMLNQTREKTAKYIGAASGNEIVFTSGTTFSLNQLVFGLKKIFQSGDEIVLTKLEHSSNLLPWIVLAQELNLQIKYLNLDENGAIILDKVQNSLSKKTKVVSFASVSNTMGALNEVKAITKIIKTNNPQTLVFVDGAQSVAHSITNVTDWGIDAFAFSAHKMYGPFGLGVLWAHKTLLEKIEPLVYGGGNNSMIDLESFRLAKIPEKFEAGTLNLSAICGFNKALDFIEEIGLENMINHSSELKKYLRKKIKILDQSQFEFYNLQTDQPIFLFNVKGVHAQDFGDFLNKKYNISVRVGKHCARLSKYEINSESTIRVSFSIFNTKAELDTLISALQDSASWMDSIF